MKSWLFEQPAKQISQSGSTFFTLKKTSWDYNVCLLYFFNFSNKEDLKTRVRLFLAFLLARIRVWVYSNNDVIYGWPQQLNASTYICVKLCTVHYIFAGYPITYKFFQSTVHSLGKMFMPWLPTFSTLSRPRHRLNPPQTSKHQVRKISKHICQDFKLDSKSIRNETNQSPLTFSIYVKLKIKYNLNMFMPWQPTFSTLSRPRHCLKPP